MNDREDLSQLVLFYTCSYRVVITRSMKRALYLYLRVVHKYTQLQYCCAAEIIVEHRRRKDGQFLAGAADSANLTSQVVNSNALLTAVRATGIRSP